MAKGGGKRKREEPDPAKGGTMGGDGAPAGGDRTKATKLERLLKLLKEGKNRDIRTAAAEQLAKVVAVDKPRAVLNLLNKVSLSRSKPVFDLPFC